MSDCSLHENQRKAGTLCRSMYCTKCPPYRGPTLKQQLEAERSKSKKLVEALTDSTISYDRMAMIKAIKEYEASD